VLSGHSQDIKYVKWHPTKNILFSASYDDTIKCWMYDENIDDWNLQYTIEGHQSTVWSLDFDRTGEFLVSSGEDKRWYVWRVSEQGFENKGVVPDSHRRAIYSCSWSKAVVPGSSPAQYMDFIATAGADNMICIFEINRDSFFKPGSGTLEFNIIS